MLAIAGFLAGSLVLPQVCHLVPQGGLMFLPIYFFTLIAAWAYGWQVGLAMAIVTPIANSVLFGMPPAAALPIILTKGVLLTGMVWLVSRKWQPGLLSVAAAVLGAQLIGCGVECIADGSLAAGMQDFRLGWPGLALQIVAATLIFRKR